MYLLITARVGASPLERKRTRFQYRFHPPVAGRKGQTDRKISITLPIHDLDEPTVNELSVLIKNNPGQSLLYFKVVDGEHNISQNFFSQNIRLNVTGKLIEFLQENSTIDFKING